VEKKNKRIEDLDDEGRKSDVEVFFCECECDRPLEYS
jgi:hypothetical protein